MNHISRIAFSFVAAFLLYANPVLANEQMPARVSLYVATDDPAHLLSTLRNLQQLMRQRAVELDQVHLVGPIATNTSLQRPPAKNSNDQVKTLSTNQLRKELRQSTNKDPVGQILAKLGAVHQEAYLGSTTAAGKTLSYSPTWQVEHAGEIYLLEGYRNVTKMFSQDGVFLKGNRNHGIVGQLARHDQRRTSARFSKSADTTHTTIGFAPKEISPDEVISQTNLPSCSNSEVTRVAIPTPATARALRTDFVVYDVNNKQQHRAAMNYQGNSLPYQRTLKRDRATGQVDAAQAFVRMAGIDCLPTRFRYTKSGEQHYAEYRRGDSAWRTSAEYAHRR